MFGNLFGGGDQSGPEQSTNQQAPTDQQVPTNQGQPDQPVNPLDAFSSMWDTTKHGDSAPPPLSLPADKLAEISNQMNFTSSLPQEIQEGISAGNADAFMAALNHVGKQAYQAALSHGTAVTGKYLDIRSEHDRQQLAPLVKRELTTQELSSTPNFNHPVVKNQLTSIARQIEAANPDADPQWVATQARNYLTELVKQISPQAPADDPTKPKGTDWDSVFSS